MKRVKMSDFSCNTSRWFKDLPLMITSHDKVIGILTAPTVKLLNVSRETIQEQPINQPICNNDTICSHCHLPTKTMKSWYIDKQETFVCPLCWSRLRAN